MKKIDFNFCLEQIFIYLAFATGPVASAEGKFPSLVSLSQVRH